jgi:hypothetical protein
LIESHAPSVFADHEHSRSAETLILPVPPPAGRVPPPLAETLQRVSELGDVTVVAEEPQPETTRVRAPRDTAEIRTERRAFIEVVRVW